MSSGLKVAAIADTPKVMTEGNWRLGMFVDEDATDEQLEKLTAVFGGQKGGPMAGLAPLVGEMLGVERAPIEVVDDGLRHSVRIGDAIDFEVEDIVPFGIETGQPVSPRRHVPPRRLGVDRCRGDAVADKRLRHRVRGEDGAVDLRSPGPPERLIASAQERAPGAGGSRPLSRRRGRASG